MKVLLIRTGALGTVVLLGWIAFAHAQRGGAVDDESTGNAANVGGDYSRPTLSPPTRDENPLRPTTPRPTATRASTADAAARRPTADPFGLQNRYPQLTSATSELPSAGPSLASSNVLRPTDDRYSADADRRVASTSRTGDRYSAPPSTLRATSESQEPAPFRADPFAMPANPTRTERSERSSLSGSTGSSLGPALPVESEGTGQPGDPRLEGVQSPQLMIQKVAPKEIQVGKPAAFRIAVRNSGASPASQVEIRDQVPRGTRLISTTPQAKRGAGGELTWTLGTIRPGEEAVVEMQLMPTTEGEIGSVATVHFGADASARCMATRPQLAVETAMPGKVLIGEQVNLSITISNPGTGTATGVVVTERIPAGLQHPAGGELEYKVGDLKPGESRKLDLALVANRPGLVANVLSARGDGNLRADDKREVEVVAPQLDVVMEGPKRRYLERQATYQLSVSNPGTASAKNVELVASLPPGLKFMSANNAGYYEEATRTVRWRLEELPAKETGSVELVTMPVEAGQHAIRLRGTAQKGLSVEREQPVLVEGIAAILFQVADTVDPVEIGGETTYEVRVMNQGSKAAANVQLTVILPSELKPLAAEGPTRNTLDGNRVIFDGLAQLAPKAETIYRVRVKATRPGDLRARFQLLTDDMQSPVTKEESTRVYADE